VSELVAAASYECQRRGTHAGFELNGAHCTVGSSPADSIWRQNVNPADLRSYPLSETQGLSRSEQLLHAADCLGWLKEEPRPPIFAFLPLAENLKDQRCLGRRSKPSLPYDVRNGATASAADGCGKARAEIFDQACMAIETMVLLADGEYSPVQSLAGRMVADTNGGTTLVNRVHLFYLHNPTHRLVLFKENWITEGHYIKRPAGEYRIWVPSAKDNHQHGPLPGMWTQADGRQWWHEGSFHQAQPMSIPPLCDNSRCLYGEAVFNIELSKAAGVFLFGGLEVATLGNGIFVHDAHPTYHAALFEQLARTLHRLHMHQEITSVILCRLILNDIIIYIKFLNDIIMFSKIV